MSWVAMGERYNLPEPMDGFRVNGERVDFYSTGRHHSVVGGQTPIEACGAEPPVDTADRILAA